MAARGYDDQKLHMKGERCVSVILKKTVKNRGFYPAKQYRLKCKYIDECTVKQGIRIDITQNQRGASYKWGKYYLRGFRKRKVKQIKYGALYNWHNCRLYKNKITLIFVDLMIGLVLIFPG